MKIVICPDSFKESLTAMQACAAIEEGWKRAVPSYEKVEYHKIPMSDGGEGMMEALIDVYGGEYIEVQTYHPLSSLGLVRAKYAWISSQKLVVIESAQAIGLDLVPQEMRNPLYTSSYGLGQLLVHANNTFIKTGKAHKILVGIGGSATVDGGIGMLQALGVKFLDKEGKRVANSGIGLQYIHTIDCSSAISFPSGAILIASDVQNPLYGEMGAPYVFGPQKGATPEIVQELEAGMKNFARCIASTLQIDENESINIPCAGAAGGLGMAFPVFCNAHVESGIETIMNLVHFSDALEDATLIITGEGKLDGQSLQGKVVFGILERAQSHGVPVVIIAGALDTGYEVFYQHGAKVLVSATPMRTDWSVLQSHAYQNLVMATFAIAQSFYLLR